MSLKVGFAEVEITPPVGTHKIGWIKDVVSDAVLDPLFARAAVIDSGGRRIAFIQLDTLCIRWTTVSDMRRRIGGMHGFPAEAVMVAATHNHAGPAVANCGDVRRDEGYVESLVTKTVALFGYALKNMVEAEVAFASGREFGVGYNRRVVMRGGTVRTHGKFSDADALCLEGPIDPELAVLAARRKSGEPLGALVNFACHPAHHGPDGMLSAGFPGVLARELKGRGCPVTLFLNGACGNITVADPFRNGAGMSMEQAGLALADGVTRLLPGMAFRAEAQVAGRCRTVRLPFRKLDDEQLRGTVGGAQRFVDPTAYDRDLPRLLERIRRMGAQPAEVQALSLDEIAWAAIPAEYFVENGLRIKERAHPRHALVVSCANGMVGYVPHRDAFLRGGYETTLWGGSRLAPEAGEMLADCALELIHQEP